MTERAQRGDDIRSRLTAATFNEFAESSQIVQQHKNNIRAGIIAAASRNTGVVLVKNDSGGDLDAHTVVGLGDPAIGPGDLLSEFQRRVSFSGVTPTSSHVGLFAILDEPIRDGSTGRAIVDGVTTVELVQADAAHKFADITAGSSATLTSTFHGAARILYYDSGTNQAIVRLIGPTNLILKGKADAEITAGSSGTVSIWENGSDTGANVTAYLDWAEGGENVASGIEVFLAVDTEGRYLIIGAECESSASDDTNESFADSLALGAFL